MKWILIALITVSMILKGDVTMGQKNDRYQLNSARVQKQIADQRIAGKGGAALGSQLTGIPKPAALPTQAGFNALTGSTGQAQAQAWAANNPPKPAIPLPKAAPLSYKPAKPVVGRGGYGMTTYEKSAAPSGGSDWLNTLSNQMAANNGQAYRSANPWANSSLSPTVNQTLPGGSQYTLPSMQTGIPNPSATGPQVPITIRGATPVGMAYNPFAPNGIQAPNAPAPVLNPPGVVPAPDNRLDPSQIPAGYENGQYDANQHTYTAPNLMRFYVNPDGTLTELGVKDQFPAAQKNWSPVTPAFLQKPFTMASAAPTKPGGGGFGSSYGGGGGGGGGGGYDALQRYLDNLNLVNWNI